MKSIIKKIPGVVTMVASLRGMRGDFKSSTLYWKQRYKNGGNSGAGSYGRLAEFKANFLNGFVEQHSITSVIEFGCGDGAQLSLARYPSYVGVDVSPQAVKLCRDRFAGDGSKQFFELSAFAANRQVDLSLSLDVIYHLVEDSVFDAYMRQLFASARLFVIIYASNMDQSWPAKHVRHRKFTRWIEENEPQWSLQSMLKNAYPFDPANQEQTSFADFFVFAR